MNELDTILMETNQCRVDDQPPEPQGKWFSFIEQPPTVEGMYLVFFRHWQSKGAMIRYAWYGKPPATPWLTHPRRPYCRKARSIYGVTHWMILSPPEPFDPFSE